MWLRRVWLHVGAADVQHASIAPATAGDVRDIHAPNAVVYTRVSRCVPVVS
jgi:hypothetical protein